VHAIWLAAGEVKALHLSALGLSNIRFKGLVCFLKWGYYTASSIYLSLWKRWILPTPQTRTT